MMVNRVVVMEQNFDHDGSFSERAGDRVVGRVNSRLRDEVLNGEFFDSLAEARVIIETWRRQFNVLELHASLRYRAPAPELFLPTLSGA